MQNTVFFGQDATIRVHVNCVEPEPYRLQHSTFMFLCPCKFESDTFFRLALAAAFEEGKLAHENQNLLRELKLLWLLIFFCCYQRKGWKGEKLFTSLLILIVPLCCWCSQCVRSVVVGERKLWKSVSAAETLSVAVESQSFVYYLSFYYVYSWEDLNSAKHVL